MKIDPSVSQKWRKESWDEKHFIIDDEGEIAYYGMIRDNKTDIPVRHYAITPLMVCAFFKEEDDWVPYEPVIAEEVISKLKVKDDLESGERFF